MKLVWSDPTVLLLPSDRWAWISFWTAVVDTICTHRTVSSDDLRKANIKQSGVVFIWRRLESWMSKLCICPCMYTNARPRTGVTYGHVWTYVWVFSCHPGRSMRPHRCCLALRTWSEWRGRRRWRRLGGERDGRCALNGCDANGTRGHRNQFSLLKQMRAAQPCHGMGSFFFGRPHCYCN